MQLYDYYRSTACYRVRIALRLKNIPYETIPIHLVNAGGEQHHPDYLTINPQGLVPALNEQGHILTQSLAIIEYLDETHPLPPLLPKDPEARAQVRSLALLIACDMHPLNNLRVLQTLREDYSASEDAIIKWYHHWLKAGFDAYEAKLKTRPRAPHVSFGNHVTLADICLIPQVYNANRFQFSMAAYPHISEITQHCLSLPEFAEPQETAL